MNILILGADGFIGSHLTRRLADMEGVSVNVVDKQFTRLQAEHYNSECLDISEQSIEDLVAVNDVVIDLVAHANPSIYVKTPLDVYNLNFKVNMDVVELCVKYDKRLIQFSTCEVYGDHGFSDEPWNEDTTPFLLGPINEHRWIYSCAKQLLERVIHAHGIENDFDYNIIRPFNFIGHDIDFLPSLNPAGNPRVFSHFLESILTHKQFKIVGNGIQYRSYTFIEDAIDAILLVIFKGESKEIYNIGNPGNELSILDLMFYMREIAGRFWDKDAFDIPFEFVAGENFYGKGYADISRRVPDVSKVTSLGWDPQSDVFQTLYKSMRPWFE